MADFIPDISPDISSQPTVTIISQAPTTATVQVDFNDANTSGVWLRSRNVTDAEDFITLAHVDTDGVQIVVSLVEGKIYQIALVAHDTNGRVGP